MTQIRFKNFIPKDEDLKPLWQEGVSLSSEYRALEREFNEAAAKAKIVAASKTPLKPNWDLKRTFSIRNKKLENLTNRAIAKLNGTSDVDMETAEDAPDVNLPESAQRLSFIEHVQELSDDEDTEFNETKRFVGGLNKADLRENEEE
jgi:hypothetical protein